LGKVNRVLTAKAQSGRVACSGETIERLKENRYERMGCVLVRLAFAPAHDTSHVLLDAKFVVVARKLFRRTESKEDETTKGEHRRRDAGYIPRLWKAIRIFSGSLSNRNDSDDLSFTAHQPATCGCYKPSSGGVTARIPQFADWSAT